MVEAALIIAFCGSVLALFLRPIRALCVFCAVLFLHPQGLFLHIGTIDFSTGRVIIIALYCNIFFRGKLWRRFKWNTLDTFVILWIVGQVIALLHNEPLFKVIENQGGASFDTLLPYFAVRLILITKKDLLTFIKSLVLIAIPLALSGEYESMTGYNFFSVFGSPQPSETRQLLGYSLYRASATFGVHISFGLLLAAIAPICLGLWHQHVWRNGSIIGISIILLLGLVSSMSSAPAFSIMVSIAWLAWYPIRRFWPYLLFFFVASCLFVEVFSNRHFYEVPTRFAFSGRTAYYRIELMEEALGGGMSGHWIAGYGFGIFEGTNPNFHWEHNDMTNLYIGILARMGLLGLLPFLVINILYYRRLYQAAKIAFDPADQWFIWCLAASLVGWNVAMMTVGVLGQMRPLLFMFAGLCMNMPAIVSPVGKELEEKTRTRRVRVVQGFGSQNAPICRRQENRNRGDLA